MFLCILQNKGRVKLTAPSPWQAREAFTKKTTEEMWARNPDYDKFPAAICYNKGYDLEDPKGMDGLLNAKMDLGVLNTE